MALTIKKDMQLVRLIDSASDNPLELTIAATLAEGRVTVLMEDRDAGTQTGVLTLDVDELLAGVALVTTKRQHYIED